MNKKYQVFVSSTFTDLKQERQACVEAILTAGHIPAGMELFSAGSESQLEIIKRWIDESDIYMLLLGGRYGSIEPKLGLSYTEIEYNYALEKGKPFFALVMHDDLLTLKVKESSEVGDVMELKNRTKYEQFKSSVLSKISSFFHNEDQLKLKVLQSLMDIQNRHVLNGWVKANESIDSVMVLNQISALTERNRQLQNEIEMLNAKYQILEVDTLNKLSEEAKELIINLYEDSRGILSKTNAGNYFVLETNGRKFPTDYAKRSIAIWEHAFFELTNNRIITVVDRGYSDTYRLTKVGFEIADKLNSNNEDEATPS